MAKSRMDEWTTREGLTLIEGWARDGLTEAQISHNMGISSETLRVWKNKNSAISGSLKKGKAVVDFEVENALYRRAIGYKYTETHTEETIYGEKRVVIEKTMPPDVTAQIFWLKNRKPEKWRDRRDSDINLSNLEKAEKLLGGVESVIDNQAD